MLKATGWNVNPTLNAPAWTKGKVLITDIVQHLTPEIGTQYPNGFYVNSGLGNQYPGYKSYQIGFDVQSWWANRLHLMPTALFQVDLDPEAPFCWISPDGKCYRADTGFITDWGSIPAIFQNLISPDECIWFLMHDCGYADHGLWVLDPLALKFLSVPLTRGDVDGDLKLGYLCQWPDRPDRAKVIWGAVRLGGWVPWGEDHAAKRKRWAGLLGLR